MKKILVTGVAGFIGSNLAERLLKEGYEVIGIDNLMQGLKEQIPHGVEFHNSDIRSPEIYPVFKGVDTVFHLAAKNTIADCQKNPVETADINVTGTINVFKASQEAGVRKVVYAESSAVYEGTSVFPTPESEERPQSFYADSKMSAYLFAKTFEKFHGLKTTGLRYFNVYGPRQDYRRSIPPIMSDFIIKMLKGERPILYGNGWRTKDYIYVDDINDFHLLAMRDARTDGEVYNLGTGKETSFKELFEIIRDLLGANIEPELMPDLPPEVGRVERTLADITKARSLGWEPKTELKDGLSKMISYIKENVIPRF